MEIKYLNYEQDLLKTVVKDNRTRLYVFDNLKNMKTAREQYHPPFLQQQSKFLMLADLKERLFTTNKVVLKEEKRTVILYRLLTDSEKEFLGIKDYFDVIELASDFFDFYKELNQYKLENLEQINNFKEWQERKLDIFQDLRKRYIKFMKESGYTDRTLTYRSENFDPHFLEKFSEVIFVNILELNPQEEEMISQIEDSGCGVKLFLQLNPGDFDEDSLRLRSLTLPRQLPGTVSLYKTGEELLQLVNMLLILKNQTDTSGTTVLDAALKQNNYHKLLSPEKVKVDGNFDFTHTGIFQLLQSLYQLLAGSDKSRGHIKLRLQDLFEACSRSSFKSYYELENKDMKVLFEFSERDYVYLSQELLEKQKVGENGTSFRKIFEDINTISSFQNLEDYCHFLDKIDVNRVNDIYYSNNHQQFLDALSELRSLADLNLVEGWGDYFEKTAIGLLRLVLNYLRYKKIKKIEPDNGEEETAVVEDLKSAAHRQRDHLILLNVNNGVIPASGHSFLLTEDQRQQLGLPPASDRRLREKYYFFRHVLTSRRSYIFTEENLEENQTCSSFVEELLWKYDLPLKKPEIGVENYNEVINSIFSPGANRFRQSLTDAQLQADKLEIESGDFPRDYFSISYYKFKQLRQCYYRFYLEHIAGLEEEWPQFERELSNKVLGTIVHKMFEDIINQLKENEGDDTAGILTPSPELIEKTVSQKIEKYRLKIPKFYFSYYDNIIVPAVRRSIRVFFERIKEVLEGEVEEIDSEWTPPAYRDFLEDEKVTFYLSGRIDLLINTSENIHLIDFKTGSSSDKQLEFYSLLLDPELEAQARIQKYFYLVMEEILTRDYRTAAKLARSLKEELEEFINSENYETTYKSSCKNCSYRNICRVVVK